MDRWQEISRLYHAVRSRAQEDRAAFLGQACESDPSLRREVESLLRHDDDAENFLQRPAFELAADLAREHHRMQAGYCLGPYEILSAIGAGGMGEVYKARDTRLKRPVAIKILSPEFSRDHDRRARFIREAQAIAALNHPRICIIHDVGEHDGLDYLVMEYLEGQTLRERISESALALDEARKIAIEVAEALSQAHQRGIVHRDVKPGNVMLTANGTKLLDFGLAKVIRRDDLKSSDFETATGVVLGTAAYMSPEQLLGLTIDPRSDVFSLGVVLYEMVTGARPFQGANIVDTIDAILHKQPEPVAGSVPQELQQVICRCLEKERHQRYVSAQELLGALEALSASTAGATVSSQRPGSALIPNNLPQERTRFIGREAALAECARLLAETRLLTVTGIGGSGKTRLTLKLAERLLQSHPEGVWFVDLSPLREASRVAEAIAVTLAIGEEPGKDLLETVVHHVRGKRLLLVLDNCEHLLDACGAVVDALLRTAEDVRVLVTSRESLGIEGERIFALRSLAVPSGTQFKLDAVKSSEAVCLFVDRAQIVDGAFVLDEQSAAPVVEICQRLDGIPLAIELAAARVKMLSVEEICSKLDDRFRLLTGGHRTLPRHQTLRAAFQWSYDLLTPEERRLFRLLAVFAGGWTLEAATAVWSDAVDEFEVLELMTRLADKSLVIVERLAPGRSRYQMLEIPRQFAQEKLEETREGDVARARHLKYFVAWSAHRQPMAVSAQQGEWLTQVEHEHENVLRALEFCPHVESGAEMALDLACNIYEYWNLRGLYSVGRDRLGAVLQLQGAVSPARSWTLAAIGELALKQGALAEARDCFEESLKLSRNSGDTGCTIAALYGLGFVSRENDPGEAHARLEEALHLARELGQGGQIGRGLGALAMLALDRGDLAQARVLFEESLAVARTLPDPWNVAIELIHLTDVALRCDELKEAHRNLKEGLRIVREHRLRGLAASTLRWSSELAVALGDTAQGIRWSAGAAVLDHSIGSKRDPERERAHAAIMARARDTLGAQEFAQATGEGAALGYEEALAEAQAWLEDP